MRASTYLFFKSANYENQFFIYLGFILTYISLIYFPIFYVITWRKANSYSGELIWITLTQLYVILSAASSNAAYIIGGGASFYNLSI